MKKLCLLLAAVVLSGCVRPEMPKVQAPPFDVAQYKQFDEKGTGRITGQLFAKTRGGDVKIGAGVLVFLRPSTPYNDSIRDMIFVQRVIPVGLDPLYEKHYVHTTTTDGNGNFEFTDLPEGKYRLIGQFGWEVPGSYPANVYTTVEVNVKNDTVKKVILTP